MHPLTFSPNLGYNIKLGTTQGGTELSNTLSDLSTGQRLISKAAPFYKNSFETDLYPNNYFVSVQSIDDGLKGGAFSTEEFYTLTYEWKLLNQVVLLIKP